MSDKAHEFLDSSLVCIYAQVPVHRPERNATEGIAMKQAGAFLGTEGIVALWLKQHEAGEEAMAASLKVYFKDLEEQVFEEVNQKIEDRLDELSDDETLSDDEIGQEAEDLADELIDVDEVYQEVLDVVRERIYDQVATGAVSEWKLNVPEKQLDLSWVKTTTYRFKEVCRVPQGESGGGQFVPCGDAGGGTAVAEHQPVPAAALQGDFSKIPSRGDAVGVASQVAVPFAGMSISQQADEAVDAIVAKKYDDVRRRYGDDLGTAIIAAGMVGGVIGAASTVAGGVLVAAGAGYVHSYVTAASALAGSVIFAPAAGAYVARLAIAPIIGASRYFQKMLPRIQSKAVTPDFAELAAKEWRGLVDEWHAELKTAAWAKGDKAIIAWMKADGTDVGGITSGLRIDLPSVMRDAVEKYAEGILARPYWRGVAETIRDDIAFDIRRGVLDGLSGRQIKESLRGTVNSDDRADNIARTETTGALNAGNQATREELSAQGLVNGKQWLGILDNDIRPTHEDANEQIVPVDEPFIVGDEEAMFPGDPELSAAERCRCRCAAVSTFDENTDLADQGDKRLRLWFRAWKKWYPTEPEAGFLTDWVKEVGSRVA